MKDFWNQRYKAKEYAYGQKPNDYLKSKLTNLTPGKILFPADGEGRNSVFAASLGWETYAFDLSLEGRNKALALAEKQGLFIDYKVGDLADLLYTKEEFDAMALIFAHFPASKKSEYHKRLVTYLKSGSVLLFEAFSKEHLRFNFENPQVGGPKDFEQLFSIEELKEDFSHFHILELYETEVELSEGLFHNGKGSVIRFLGEKK